VNQNNLKSAYAFLIISLANIFTFITLFNLRSFDDNRLTSWQWAFTPDHLILFFPLLIFGLGLAYILSQIVALNRNPIFLFLFSFFTTALFWQAPEVIVDAARYFTQAKHLKIYGIGYFLQEWGKDITAWTDMPLVPFLYGLIFKFFGEHRICIQIFTTLLFSMTVILTYMIGACLWDEDTGLTGGLLLLGIPYLFSQVPLMLVDVPAMFFFTFSIFAVIKALEQGTIKWMGIASIALFLVFYSKYSTWLWLSVLIPICAVYLKINPRTTARRVGVIGGLSLIIIGVGLLIYYDVILDQLRLLMSYQKPGLKRWGESFISTFFFQIHPFITVAALYSIYVAFRKKDLKYAIISYLVFLAIFMQIKRIRYVIPLFPMFTLMASYGLMQIRNSEIRRFIVFCIIISSLVLAYFAYLPFLQTISTVNLKNSGKFLNSLDVANIEVFTLPQEKSIINPAISVPLLDLFTNKRVTYGMDIDPTGVWEKVKNSALRFTWEYKNPPYYMNDTKYLGKVTAVVVISSDPNQLIPEHIEQRIKKYNSSKEFKTFSNLFRYRTVVTVYYD
jgi:hypothetical protein